MERSDRAGQGDRFVFTVFLSICAHALIILGIGFSLPAESRDESPLDITIASYRSEIPPQEADFRAQENQTGSGSLDVAAAPATLYESEFHAETIEEVLPLPQIPDSGEENAVAEVIAAEGDLANADLAGENRAEAATDEISLAIASLQAQLDRRRQAYAKRPRTYTISSASTQKSHDALYLDNWRRHVEAVGNRNYPSEAEHLRLYGSLRLLVSQMPDGSVNDVEILSSSGHELLDRSAVDIVRMAAPFEPFPAELRSEVDILEIIRTWRFHEAEGLTSY